jgi:hypothetical protein
MSKRIRLQLALAALLVASALVNRAQLGPWSVGAMVAFGLLNIFLAPPGTAVVRAPVIAICLAALWWYGPAVAVLLGAAAFLWPAAFGVAWILGQLPRTETRAAAEAADAAPEMRPRLTLAAIIAAAMVASVWYRAIVEHGVQQTAALFIGLPAVLAIVIVVFVSPRSAVGVACKAVTVGLLVSVLFLGEGFLCVIFAAPLFYAVAIAVATAIDRTRRDPRTTMSSSLLLLLLAPMNLEGVTPMTTIERTSTVSASKIVHASSERVAASVLAPPQFERGRPRPAFLRLGFPTPVHSRIERQGSATRWVVQIRGGEMLLNGMEHRTGDLVLDLEEARPALVRWRVRSDTSHMTHFLTFRASTVQWQPIDAHTTRVTWTIDYERGLDPAWYFGPMERYATWLAARYLIDTVAAP